ncbi:MAG: hypothetical protein ABJE95_16765 [Byssovorax sp.]
MTTTPSRLQTSLLTGWDRAVLASLAEDLGHDFVDLVLPLLPEAAPELLRLLANHQGYNELWLLRSHAPLLWRHARDQLLARLDVVLPMVSPVELLASIARKAPPHEQDELRALARATLEREHDPMRRGRALLEWAPFEAPDRGAAMIAEALDLVRSATPSIASAIVGRHAGRFNAAQRAELRAIAGRPDAAVHGASLLLSLALDAAPDEALADARAALSHEANADPGKVRYVVCALLDVVPFAIVRPWVEIWIRAIETRRDLCFAARELAPHAPTEILDLLLARADEIPVEIWGRVQILADVARHHPTRREALREEVRRGLARIVGDATLGHGLRPDEVPAGAHLIVLQAHAIARASAGLGGDVGALQRCVLARIAEMPSDFEDRHVLDRMLWDDLGAALDPSARADAVRAALSLRDRPAALKALGQMVAQFPPEARHLGLDGLSRLADATPPEAMKRALQALTRARTDKAAPAKAPSGKSHGRGGDTLSGWTAQDQRSLAPLASLLGSSGYLDPDRLKDLARPLTPAAATRAAALVLAMTSSSDHVKAMMAVVSAPELGNREREELLAAVLKRIGGDRHERFDAAELAQAIGEVCSDRDPIWADRLAAFFEAHRPEREPFLDRIAAFAPLLRRLGGPELLSALTLKLKAPLPVPEFARPWADAARGTFDA